MLFATLRTGILLVVCAFALALCGCGTGNEGHETPSGRLSKNTVIYVAPSVAWSEGGLLFLMTSTGWVEASCNVKSLSDVRRYVLHDQSEYLVGLTDVKDGVGDLAWAKVELGKPVLFRKIFSKHVGSGLLSLHQGFNYAFVPYTSKLMLNYESTLLCVDVRTGLALWDQINIFVDDLVNLESTNLLVENLDSHCEVGVQFLTVDRHKNLSQKGTLYTVYFSHGKRAGKSSQPIVRYYEGNDLGHVIAKDFEKAGEMRCDDKYGAGYSLSDLANFKPLGSLYAYIRENHSELFEGTK